MKLRLRNIFKQNSIYTNLLTALLVAASTVPVAVYLKLHPYSEFFVSSRLAYIYNSLNSFGRFPDLFKSDVPGMIILNTALSSILGIPASELQHIPLSLVMIGAAAFALSMFLFKSPIVSLITILTVFLNNTLGAGYWSVDVHGYGTVFYLFFLLVLLLMLEEGRQVKLILITIVLFSANHFVDYTAEMWMLASILMLEVCLLFNWKLLNDQSARLTFNYSLPVLFTVLFLGFNELIYRGYLGIIGSFDVLTQSIVKTLSKLIPWLATNVPDYEYQYINPIPEIIFKMNLLHLIILVFPVMISFFFILFRLIRPALKAGSGEKSSFSVFHYLLFCVIGTTLSEFIIYIFLGQVRLSYLVVVFPIVSIGCLFNQNIFFKETLFRKARFFVVFFVVFLLSAMAYRYSLNIEYGLFPQTSYTMANPSADWLFSKKDSDSGNKIMSDLDTLGKYVIKGACMKKKYETVTYTSDIYEHLVSEEYLEKNKYLKSAADIIVIDEKNTRGVSGWWWRLYKPVTGYNSQITSNHNIIKVYDDDLMSIYKTF